MKNLFKLVFEDADNSMPSDMLDYVTNEVSWDSSTRGPKLNLIKVFTNIWTDLPDEKQQEITEMSGVEDKVQALIGILRDDEKYQTQIGNFIQQYRDKVAGDEEAMRKKQEYLQSFQGQQDMETLAKADARTGSSGAASHNADVQRALDDVNRWNQLNNTDPGNEQTKYNLQMAQAKLQSLMATAVRESEDLTRIKTLTSRLLNK